MTFNKEYFIDFKPIKGKVYLAGEKNEIESKGIGSMKIKVQNDKGAITYVIMYDVVYVPDLRNNLLSVMKLMDRGLKVDFSRDKVRICQGNNGEIIAVGERMDNHFVIDLTPIHERNVNKCDLAGINNEEGATVEKFSTPIEDVWHRRLGHVNNKYMQRLIKEKMVVGINDKVAEVDCDACKTCKLPRKPHKSVNYEQSNDTLQLLHMDICGSMPVESIGGSRYMLLIIDDYSGMYFTYFLKNKSDVLSTFKIFKRKCENMLGKEIKAVRTDNGTEFINCEFREFTNKEGIEHQKTVPYNPESNGKVERGNRVIIERARTILHESNLPLNFWAEAIAYISHSINLTPRKNKDKTSYELWFNKVPNITYLKTFGCLAYCHVPKNARNKLQPSGKKTIMVGYSRERVGYRLFDLERNLIIEERNVTFNESVKGSHYLNEPELIQNKEEKWCIEDILKISDHYDAGTRNKDHNESDRETDENINDSDQNDERQYNPTDVNLDREQSVKTSVGRPKGSTSAENLRRKQEMLDDREERLRAEGVR